MALGCGALGTEGGAADPMMTDSYKYRDSVEDRTREPRKLARDPPPSRGAEGSSPSPSRSDQGVNSVTQLANQQLEKQRRYAVYSRMSRMRVTDYGPSCSLIEGGLTQ